jgi:hypothetical protein
MRLQALGQQLAAVQLELAASEKQLATAEAAALTEKEQAQQHLAHITVSDSFPPLEQQVAQQQQDLLGCTSLQPVQPMHREPVRHMLPYLSLLPGQGIPGEGDY